MASFLYIVSIFLFTHKTWSQQIQSTHVKLDSSLSPTSNSSWLSPSGLYGFGFYQQGQGYKVGIFLAKTPQKTVVWTANRDDPPVSNTTTLILTNDGQLLLRSSDGEETILSNAYVSASGASMSNSGNFMLYDSNSKVIWQSFDYPTNTLLPTQLLLAGKELFSSISNTSDSTGIFRLKMQHDGNLVMYPINTPDTAPYSYFASWALNQGDNVSLNIDPDGHICMLNTKGVNVKNITDGGYQTENTTYLLRIDPDGLLRLYSYSLDSSNSWRIEWSAPKDKCGPKGLCGLNGYCDLVDQEAACRCLPGFKSVMQGNQTAGCERDFTLETCKNEGEIESYKMEPIDNMQWEDDPYSVLSLPDKESCAKACLEDCDCHAALFDDGHCKKQRLPLRYGRILSSESTSAIIKVGVTNHTNNRNNSLGFLGPGGNKKRINKDVLGISVLLIVFGSVMLFISVIIIYRNKIRVHKNIDCQSDAGFGTEITPRLFTYAELESCTGGFKEEIGRGAFGKVYKGMIQDSKKPIAVKRLDKLLSEGEREFRTEVEIIGRTHHRNLVQLLGYCVEGPNRLLVYEYMSNGSLAHILFRPEKQLPCWKERMEIVRDIARGISYLHEECETQIIHCDIKPQNILIGKCAKISDFGLAKLLGPDQTKTYTGIRGTRGYVAPEWHRRQPVTAKADVYSFGIVLLEIICCRRNIDLHLMENEIVLEDLVRDYFVTNECDKLVGDEEVDMKEFKDAIMVGLWCISEDPAFRPTMKKVLYMLEGTMDIPIPSISSFSSCQ